MKYTSVMLIIPFNLSSTVVTLIITKNKPFCDVSSTVMCTRFAASSVLSFYFPLN